MAAGGLILGLVVVGGLAGSGSAGAAGAGALAAAIRDQMCPTPGAPLGRLTAQQSANAASIVSVIDSLSAENPQAVKIALMTAITESGLHDTPGGLGGAVGLFQQTPADGWGAAAQLLNPSYAAAQFGRHLLAVPHWQSLPPWVAAQDVQRSGAGQPASPLNPAPGVVGGNYKLHWSQALALYTRIAHVLTVTGCGGGPGAGVVSPPGRHGLPVGYRIPPGTPRRVRLVLAFALSKLGDGYVWAAAGPNSFDCSGLTMAAWAQAGVHLLHYTVDQMHEGHQVAASAVKPGDLVLIPGADAPGPGLPGHVGIYLGYGLVESAIDPAQGVAVQSWQVFTGGGLDAVVNPLAAPATTSGFTP